MAVIKSIFERELSNVVTDIQNKLSSSGANATGKTRDSLRYEATDSRGILFGGKSFAFVEEGRGPGRRPPTKPLFDWVLAKGIESDEKKVKGIAYAIAAKIASQGTSTVSKNKPRDIYTSIVDDRRVKSITEQIRGVYADKVLSDIVKEFKEKK